MILYFRCTQTVYTAPAFTGSAVLFTVGKEYEGNTATCASKAFVRTVDDQGYERDLTKDFFDQHFVIILSRSQTNDADAAWDRAMKGI